jgi:hypothetical protein
LNDSLTNYLGYVDGLLADPLRIARAGADAGSKIVGYFGDEIPVSLIAASGALPVRVRGQAGRPTPRADGFMESAFSPSLRAIAEQWLEGDLNFLSAMVFPRSDDSAQRLYYYFCELQRRGRCAGPRPVLYDIAKIARPASIAHSRDSTRRLAEELGMDASLLAASRRRVAQREALLATLRSRRHEATPLAGALAWRVHQAAEYDWREDFDDATRQWLLTAPTLRSPLRVALAGDATPDDSLHRAIEAAGGSIVLELTESLPGIESADAPELDAIADHFQSRRGPVLAMRDDPSWVARCAATVHADAVLFWLIEEDEALPWEVSRQMRALREQGIPTLLLTRQHWVADERARQQVNEFMTGLKVSR